MAGESNKINLEEVMRQSFIDPYFEAVRTSSTFAELELVLKEAQATLTKAEYNLLLARLIIASRSRLGAGQPATQWQYPLLVEQLRSAGAGDTDSTPAGTDET